MDHSKQNSTASGFTHERIETNSWLLIILVLCTVAIGGLVEIVPLFFQRSPRSRSRA
jgi:cytochrome c oxidase cbb3-type subunit 2